MVAVVSAMGDRTDELTDLALEINDQPDHRELDILLSTGELISCTLTAMALNALGLRAKSLAGPDVERFGRHAQQVRSKNDLRCLDIHRVSGLQVDVSL